MGVRGCHPPLRLLFLSISLPLLLLPPQSLLRVPFARLRRSTRRTGGGGGGEEKGALDDYSAGEDSFEKMHARNGEEFPEIRERSSSSSNEEGRNYHAI